MPAPLPLGVLAIRHRPTSEGAIWSVSEHSGSQRSQGHLSHPCSGGSYQQGSCYDASTSVGSASNPEGASSKSPARSSASSCSCMTTPWVSCLLWSKPPNKRRVQDAFLASKRSAPQTGLLPCAVPNGLTTPVNSKLVYSVPNLCVMASCAQCVYFGFACRPADEYGVATPASCWTRSLTVLIVTWLDAHQSCPHY